MKRLKGAMAIFAIAVSLSGCGNLTSLPDNERYQFINQVKADLNYSTAGEVVTEAVDNGDGVFSPSVFRTEMKGESTYEELKKRIESLPNVKCIDSKTQMNCKQGQVDIYLNQDESQLSKVVLRLTDVYSGRIPSGRK